MWKSSKLDIAISLPWIEQSVFEREYITITSGPAIGVLIIVLLTWLNCRGVQSGKRVQNVFAVAKTAALLMLIVVGLFVAANSTAIQANTSDVWTGAAGTPQVGRVHEMVGGPTMLAILMVLGGAMVGSLFSADAWNNITFTAGEVKEPHRTLPLSLVLGVGMVITLYLLANVAYLAALPLAGDQALAKGLKQELKDAQEKEGDQQRDARALVEAKYQKSVAGLGIDQARDDRVGTAVMALWSPRFGAPLMAVAIMISTFGCVNGLVLMGARLYYAMARDGLFFQAVGRLNPRGVPAVGLVLQGAWASVLVFSGTYGDLLDYVIFAALLFYVLTVAGLFVLRRTRPDAVRPYRVIGYPVVPGLYIGLCAAIMIDLLIVKPRYTWPGLILVLCGIPVYYAWRRLGRRREDASVTDTPAARLTPDD